LAFLRGVNEEACHLEVDEGGLVGGGGRGEVEILRDIFLLGFLFLSVVWHLSLDIVVRWDEVTVAVAVVTGE
jgi:hypothetical protein